MNNDEESSSEFEQYKHIRVSIPTERDFGDNLKFFPDAGLLKSFEGISQQFASNFKLISELSRKNSFALILEQMSRLTPSNYYSIFIEDQLTLVKLSSVMSFGTIEILPQEILTEILKITNDPTAIDDLLVNQDKLILDSISNFLLRIKDSRLWSECGIFIEKSREAYLDGHFEASQTLNVATLDSFLIANFAEWKIYKKLSDKYKEPDIETMQSFEELYDFGAFGPVISAYQDGKSADNFSRHKTSHELSLIQVNRLNAIKSLTIVSGLLARFWAYEERLREN